MLFVGRVIPLKGVEIAVQLSLDTGVPLIIAGPGDLDWCLSHSLYDVSIKSTEELKKRGVHFVGQIDVEERKKLMRDAKFLICPTNNEKTIIMPIKVSKFGKSKTILKIMSYLKHLPKHTTHPAPCLSLPE